MAIDEEHGPAEPTIVTWEEGLARRAALGLTDKDVVAVRDAYFGDWLADLRETYGQGNDIATLHLVTVESEEDGLRVAACVPPAAKLGLRIMQLATSDEPRWPTPVERSPDIGGRPTDKRGLGGLLLRVLRAYRTGGASLVRPRGRRAN
jgi:hypothetical protein